MLSIARDARQGRRWICKDPIRRRYYALSESEHALWQMLDGQTSLAQITDRYASLFPPKRLEASHFMAFVARLYRQELVVALSPGQGEQLLARARTRRLQQYATAPFKLLAWRLRGIDPDQALNRIVPYTGWLFSRTCRWVLLALIGIAMTIVFSSSQELLAETPQLSEFFTAENLLLLGLTLSAVKVLHEFGHAVSCKLLGGEVREIGLMFLFFSPCLYCDVSDAWLFRQRWQRMFVSAAGMLVEIALAALATIIWSLTQPGVLHNICLNVMVVCGISTLLINGNPLMRYDGYYLLSDALDLPNLDERARARLRQLLASLVFGIALPSETLDRERRGGFVLAYAILSTVYRWLLLASVLWMLHAVLQPRRLEVVAILLATMCLLGVIAMPLWETLQQLRNPFFWQRISPTQVVTRVSIIGALLALAMFVPLPCRVAGPGIVESTGAQSIYATTPGKIVTTLAPGTDVQPGQTVVELDNQEVRLALARVQAEAARLRVRVEALESLRSTTPDVASEIPAAQELLLDVNRQVAQYQQELGRLNLVAHQPGRVIEPLWRSKEADNGEHLTQWMSSPLANHNRGGHIEAGTLVAQIVDPSKLEVQLLLDQSMIGLVDVGQRAYVSLWQAPGEVVQGTVVEVSRQVVDKIPPALSASGDIAVQPNSQEDAPLVHHYQVRIRIDDQVSNPLIGGRCTARVVVASQSIASRALRYLRQTFSRS